MGARKEEISTHVPAIHLEGINCEEIRVTSEPGVSLRGIVVRGVQAVDSPPRTVMLYLQGKALQLCINLPSDAQ